MSKEYLEAFERIKTSSDIEGNELHYWMDDKDIDIVENGLKRLDALDSDNPSEVLNYLEELEEMIEYFTRLDYVEPIVRNEIHDKFKDIYWHKLPHLDSIKNALLKVQEPKHYLRWEDLEFNHKPTKTIPVKMGDSIYELKNGFGLVDESKVVFISKEGLLCCVLREQDKQFFNDLHLEAIKDE